MEKPEVLVTLPSSLRSNVHELLERRLLERGCVLTAFYRDEPLGEKRLRGAIAGAAAYIVAL